LLHNWNIEHPSLLRGSEKGFTFGRAASCSVRH